MCLLLAEMSNGISHLAKTYGYVFVITISKVGERMWKGCLVNYFVLFVKIKVDHRSIVFFLKAPWEGLYKKYILLISEADELIMANGVSLMFIEH